MEERWRPHEPAEREADTVAIAAKALGQHVHVLKDPQRAAALLGRLRALCWVLREQTKLLALRQYLALHCLHRRWGVKILGEIERTHA